MHTQTIVFVLCIFISTLVEGAPSNTNSIVKVKDLRVLGVKAKLATYKFSFSEELYLHKSNYCPAYNCASDNVVYVNQPACVCDYTNTTTCGNGFQLSSPSSPCSCDASNCDSTNSPFTGVTLNGRKSFSSNLKEGETRNWRLFVNSGCKGFRTFLTTTYGASTLYVSTEGQATLQNSLWTKTNQYEKEEVVICPTDPHFIQGTYFISVTAETDTSFNLVIEELMVAQPNATSQETCGYSTATCLHDGVPSSFSNLANSSAVIPPYAFNVSFANRECAPVFIHLQEYLPGQQTTFEVVFLRTGDNEIQYSGSSSESFIICPVDGEPWTVIQINVVPLSTVGGGSQTNHRLTVSTSYFSSHWTHTRLTDLAPFEVNFDLLGSASVDIAPYAMEPQGSVLTCKDWRTDCKGLSFATSENQLFPVPPILLNLPGSGVFKSVQGNFYVDTPKCNSKTFTAVVLMSYQTQTANVTIIPTNYVEQISVKFRGKVGNSAGVAINGTFKAKLSQPHCDYSQYKKYQDRIKDLMDDVSQYIWETSEMNTLLYQIATNAYQDGFNACENMVDGLTVGVSNTTASVRNYYCNYSAGTEEFNKDPCCSEQAAFSSTCYQRNATSFASLFEVQTTAAKSTCKNYGCSTSYLQDYSNTKATLAAGQCAVNTTSQQIRTETAIKAYLKCKDQAFPFAGKTCMRDADCFYSYDNVTYPCSMKTRTCLVPYQAMEKGFMKCLTTKMSSLQEYYLARKYNWTYSFGDPRILDAWMAQVNTSDCVSLYGNSINLNHRQKYLNSPTDKDCADKYSCSSFECEDSTCQYKEDTCQQTCGMSQAKVDASPSQCTSEAVCNWDSALCEGESLTSCTALCSGSDFCGFCDSFGDCTQFSEITTSEQCASTSVCLLPNGTYFFNLTDAQCNALTKCNLTYCGRECRIGASTNSAYSSGICFSYEASSTDCMNNGGTWMSNSGPANFSGQVNICVYPATDNTTCATYGNSRWESCGSISNYECSQCANGDCGQLTQNLMTCSVVGKPCSDSTTCTSSGMCTDSDYLVDMDSTPSYGRCVIPKQLPTESTSYLYCPPGMITLPKHCAFDPAVVSDMEACTNASSLLPPDYQGCTPFWLAPAENKTQCQSLSGCRELYGVQQRFSLKNKGNCTWPNTEWANVWTWKPGQWVGSVQRNLTWTARQAYSKYNWTTTLDFTKVEEDFIGIAVTRSSVEYKQAVLCQYQLTLDPMQAVSCDCSGGDSKDCFNVDSKTLVALILACPNVTASRNYTGMMLTFNNDTAVLACTSIRISRSSRENYATSTKQKLLSNFIPLTEKEIPSYAIKNSHDIVVGNILADGVALKPLGLIAIGLLELCIEVPGGAVNMSSEFPVLDFGVKNSSLGSVTIMNASVFQKTTNTSVFVCANVGNILAENSYFVIERKSDYTVESEELLSPTAKALTYTLGFLFLIASLLTTGQLGFYIYNWIAGNIPLLLEHFLCLSIWLFVNVRTIYFFLLAGGVDSATADYALVALPTFFYFTAFSVIVVLWAVVASKKFTTDSASFQKLINRLLIGVNGFLYTLFLILVLCFQFATQTTTSPCVSGSEDNSEELKRKISLAYGIVIASISMIIGVLFLVFGFRLRMHITSQTHDKIFIVTGVCSLTFILHSLFIIVVAVLKTPNLYFSFCGLLITEWFPALFVISWVFVKRASHISSSQEKSSVNLNTMKRSGSPMSLNGGSSQESRRIESNISGLSHNSLPQESF